MCFCSFLATCVRHDFKLRHHPGCAVLSSPPIGGIKWSNRRIICPPAGYEGHGMLFRTAPTGRRFQLALIKPSHYDDEGYVIQWIRSVIPSNTLAVLYSLFQDSAARQALGADVAIDISVVDEITTRVRPNQIVKRFRRHGTFGLVIFAGVQTNQYPRTLDLARPLRDAGIPVAIGGFHVSGCLAMLPGLQPDLQEAIDMGISLFAGELEGHCDDILRAAANGRSIISSMIFRASNQCPCRCSHAVTWRGR